MSTGGVLLGHGQVRHVRLRPTRHAFDYSAYFLMLPMRRLNALAKSTSQTGGSNTTDLALNKAGLLAFFDTDHGDGRSPQNGGALAWIEELLESQKFMMPKEKFGFKHFPECWAIPSSP